ncbi:MAG: tetratricopeptide repeat protein [Candidatus Obscuribacterales bacterium]|nr:tetratricopeptide repeat protein [Candidatus Obscuribacterales bacterium]
MNVADMTESEPAQGSISDLSERIRFLRQLADSYLSRSMYEQSELLLWEVLEIQHGLHGTVHPELVETMLAIGELNERLEKFSDAESFYASALSIVEELENSNKSKLGRVLLKLLGIYGRRGDREKTFVFDDRLRSFLLKESKTASEIDSEASRPECLLAS